MNGANLRDMVNELAEQKLLATHTAFWGRVTALNGARASVQPLYCIRQHQGAARPWPLVVNAPRLRGLSLKEDDLVLCLCCERDSAEALQGRLALPAPRRHSLADAVIVGVLQSDEGL